MQFWSKDANFHCSNYVNLMFYKTYIRFTTKIKYYNKKLILFQTDVWEYILCNQRILAFVHQRSEVFESPIENVLVTLVLIQSVT